MFTLYSALANPHMENCEQYSGSQWGKHEFSDPENKKMIRGLELLSYEETLRDWSAWRSYLESSFAGKDVGSWWIAVTISQQCMLAERCLTACWAISGEAGGRSWYSSSAKPWRETYRVPSQMLGSSIQDTKIVDQIRQGPKTWLKV